MPTQYNLNYKTNSQIQKLCLIHHSISKINVMQFMGMCNAKLIYAHATISDNGTIHLSIKRKNTSSYKAFTLRNMTHRGMIIHD